MRQGLCTSNSVSWTGVLTQKANPNETVGVCAVLEFVFRQRGFSRIGCLVEQIDKDSVVELAVAVHIGAPNVNSRAEIANMQRIRQRGARIDDEARLLWEAQ